MKIKLCKLFSFFGLLVGLFSSASSFAVKPVESWNNGYSLYGSMTEAADATCAMFGLGKFGAIYAPWTASYASPYFTCQYGSGKYSASLVSSSPPPHGSCVPFSGLTPPVCTCDSGFIDHVTTCDPPPVLTALQIAAKAAYDAAIAAGKSAAAAQAASDAVTAHPEWGGSPSAQAGIGAAAADSYTKSIAAGIPASTAASFATSSTNAFASIITANGTMAQATSFAATTSAFLVTQNAIDAITSGTPTVAQVAANMAAGALTIAAVAGAIAGAAPVGVALAAAGAIHAAVIGANIDTANPITAAAVQAAATQSIKSGATPLQVTLGVSTAAAASSSATSVSAATAAGNAVLLAMTNPNADWSMPITPTLAQTQSVNYLPPSTSAADTLAAISGMAAGSAAVTAVNSGLTISAAGFAGEAAGSATAAGAAASAVDAAAVAAGLAGQAGFTPAAAASAGKAAAGVSSGLSGAVVGAAAGAANMGTTEGLLRDVRALLGFGQTFDSSIVGTTPDQNAVGFASGLSQVTTDLKAAEATDESSVMGFFTLSLPSASCTPSSKAVHGVSVSLDWCVYTEKLRELLAWLFAVFGAWSVYGQIFKEKS